MHWTSPLLATLGTAAFLAVANPVTATSDWPDGYKLHHTYAEVHAELAQLARDHPDLVQLKSMGRSYEGRKIWVAKISDNVATGMLVASAALVLSQLGVEATT